MRYHFHTSFPSTFQRPTGGLMLSRIVLAWLFGAAFAVPLAPQAWAQPKGSPSPNYTRKGDVIYGRKYGLAMTMDVFTPKENANGRGIIFCVSGGWFSAKEAINIGFIQPLVNRGYTVFAVVH